MGIGQVSLQQSQGTAQLTPAAPELLLGLPPEDGFHFSALNLLTGETQQEHTGTWQTMWLGRYSPKAIFGQGEYRFVILSRSQQQLIAVKAKRHHSKLETTQDVLKDRTEV